MAGDWIPIETATPRKTEVLGIAKRAECSRREVVGTMVEFWCWASEQSADGELEISIEILAELFGNSVKFWQAVVDVGWLIETEDGLSIPRAGHWISKGAKARLQATDRKRMSRSRHTSVTGNGQKNSKILARTKKHVDQRDGQKCVYCGFAHGERPPFGPYVGAKITYDHVVPQSRGGDGSPSNVVCCCSVCNRAKSDHLLSELGWKAEHASPECRIEVTGLSRQECDKSATTFNTEEKRSVSVSDTDLSCSESIFDSLPENLSDTRALLDWFKGALVHSGKPKTLRDSQQGFRNVVWAAVGAERAGKPPARLFRYIVGKGEYGKLDEDDLPQVTIRIADLEHDLKMEKRNDKQPV